MTGTAIVVLGQTLASAGSGPPSKRIGPPPIPELLPAELLELLELVAIPIPPAPPICPLELLELLELVAIPIPPAPPICPLELLELVAIPIPPAPPICPLEVEPELLELTPPEPPIPLELLPGMPPAPPAPPCPASPLELDDDDEDVLPSTGAGLTISLGEHAATKRLGNTMNAAPTTQALTSEGRVITPRA